MSASTLVLPNTPQTITAGGLISSKGVFVNGLGADNTQYFTFQQYTASQGGAFDTMGGGGGGLVQNRRYGVISQFVPGRTYAQWGLVQSKLVPANYYTKTTAGSQVLTADPSVDGANWANATTQPAASLFNGTEMVAETIILRGDQPSQIQWLGEAFGSPVATLSGRPANGSATSDGALRVNGLTSTEGLRIDNSINHASAPSIGTGTLDGTGSQVVNTQASDASARIFITPTSAGAGSLYVINKLAASFEVVSSAGVADAGRTYDWWVVNPVW